MQTGRTSFSLPLLVILALATPAFGVDGVIEISQARALAGGINPVDTPGFPITIDQSGSYRLTSDLNVSSESCETARSASHDPGGSICVSEASHEW